MLNFDVAVVGSGPAGEASAIAASKKGLSVCMIEKYTKVGGNCTHNGTIPSKALRHIVSLAQDYNRSPLFNEQNSQVTLSIKDSINHANRVIRKQVERRNSSLRRNNIKLFFSKASFTDNQSLVINNGNEPQEITASNYIIATGSSPFRPSEIDFTQPGVFDSTTVLSLEHTPRNMVIYGAGVIGSEYASIFNALGVKVTLINTRDTLLSFLDRDLSEAISFHFRSEGINLKQNEQLESVTRENENIIVRLVSGKIIACDTFLYANGRSGNTSDLNLGKVGIKVDNRGNIKTNNQYKTSNEKIYAIGDVIGAPSLASSAFDQGRLVGTHIATKSIGSLVKSIPSGIYTIPEMSSLGATEVELTAAKIPYEVGKAHFRHLARAQIASNEVGFLKILFHVTTKEILGVHCFGERSSEIIHIGQAIMESSDNDISYFAKTTFNYPTMAEAYRVAALNGLNKIK